MLYGIVAQPKPAHSIQIYNHTALCCVYVYNKLNICSISTHPDDVSLLTLDLLWQLKGSTPVCSVSIGNNNLCNKSTYIHTLILINNCYGEGVECSQQALSSQHCIQWLIDHIQRDNPNFWSKICHCPTFSLLCPTFFLLGRVLICH